MTRTILPVLAALVGLAGAGTALAEETEAADIEAGETAYQAVCRNCHGPKAQGVASYPKLADKEAAYLVERLERYRAGERIGPNSMLMIPHAKELSDAEITNITTYITQELQP